VRTRERRTTDPALAMTNERLRQLRSALQELRDLQAAEKTTGTATPRILDLEDSLGDYVDVLQEAVNRADTAIAKRARYLERRRMDGMVNK